MRVVETGVQFDVGARGDFAKGLDFHVDGAHAEDQQIGELLAGPGRDVNAVQVTALDILGDLDRQQQWPPTLPGHVEHHSPHGAHELRKMITQLPLSVRWEHQRRSGKVDQDPVEIAPFRDLLEDLQLELAHFRNGEVEVDLLALRPERVEQPFGMGLLEWNRPLVVRVAVGAVDAVIDRKPRGRAAASAPETRGRCRCLGRTISGSRRN